VFNWTMTLRNLIIFLKGPAFLTGILHTFLMPQITHPCYRVAQLAAASGEYHPRNKEGNQRKEKEGEGHLDSGVVDGGFRRHECRAMKRGENARKRRREERTHCDSDTMPSSTNEAA
jgi:hypothetical protein